MHCANSTPSNRKLCVWEIVLLSREVQPRSNHGVALTPGQRTEMDGRADWGKHVQCVASKYLSTCNWKNFWVTVTKSHQRQLALWWIRLKLLRCVLYAQMYLNVYSDVLFLLRCVLIFTQVCYFCSDVVWLRYANGDQREGFFTDSSLEGQVKTIMSAN